MRLKPDRDRRQMMCTPLQYASSIFDVLRIYKDGYIRLLMITYSSRKTIAEMHQSRGCMVF